MKSLKIRDEKGFMAAEWTGAVAFLMIPTFIVVVSLLQFPPRKSLTQVASTEAARAYVQVLDSRQADTSARAAAADVIAAEFGRSKDQILKEMESGSIKYNVVNRTNGYCPGSEVTIRISVPAPVSANPFSKGGQLFSAGSISSTATERIDDYAEIYTEDVCNEEDSP